MDPELSFAILLCPERVSLSLSVKETLPSPVYTLFGRGKLFLLSEISTATFSFSLRILLVPLFFHFFLISFVTDFLVLFIFQKKLHLSLFFPSFDLSFIDFQS